MEFFHRELAARTLLADQPLVPQLLAHGPNWLLTPEYTDDGAHRLRAACRAFDGMDQLRPWATRALAEFARTLHDRGPVHAGPLARRTSCPTRRPGSRSSTWSSSMPYADFDVPAPQAQGAWTYRGLPAELAGNIDLPRLALTRGVGNSVFHPAVAGLPIERLLAPPRRGDGPAAIATQLGWYATLATAGRLHALLRRGR